MDLESSQGNIRDVLLALLADPTPLAAGSSGSRPPLSAVPVQDAATFPYAAFLRDHLAANMPVLIRGACADWSAMQKWRSKDTGAVNFAHLAEHFGGDVVCTTDTSQQADGRGAVTDQPLNDYLHWWEQRTTQPSSGAPLWYCKDWHLRRLHPEYDAYSVPQYFKDDWLNQHADDHGEDDYRFAYMGPAGTWTPLHADVLRSYSWSVNVTGRKRWLLLPPKYTPLLLSGCGRCMPSHFRAVDLRRLSTEAMFEDHELAANFPGLTAAWDHVLEVVQEAGEALFVPSGWHHTVENLEDTVSINHNWINAFNLDWVVAALVRDHEEASQGILDCRATCSGPFEFEELVQRNLRASSGMDFPECLRFLGAMRDAAQDTLPVCCAVTTNTLETRWRAFPDTQSLSDGQLQSVFDLNRIAAAARRLVTRWRSAWAALGVWYDVQNIKLSDCWPELSMHE